MLGRGCFDEVNGHAVSAELLCDEDLASIPVILFSAAREAPVRIQLAKAIESRRGQLIRLH